MATIKEGLDKLMTADGAMAAAVVDSTSGMVLGKIGSGIDLDVACAGNTEVMRAKIKTMRALGLKDEIEDILITLGKHYHIIRPIAAKPGLFIYYALDKAKSNLAMARMIVKGVEQELQI